MNENVYLTLDIDEIKKLEDTKAKYRVKCSCGATATLIEADRKICYRCGHWLYRDEKTKFKYELINKIKEAKNEHKR